MHFYIQSDGYFHSNYRQNEKGNMKLFVAIILIGFNVFGGLILNSQMQNLVKSQEISTGISTSGYVVGSFDYSTIFSFALNKESTQVVDIQEFPSFKKHLLNVLIAEKNAEQSNNSRIPSYLFFAECKITRLAGPDIIHPFNYFW